MKWDSLEGSERAQGPTQVASQVSDPGPVNTQANDPLLWSCPVHQGSEQRLWPARPGCQEHPSPTQS